jgi:hypothetical protein
MKRAILAPFVLLVVGCATLQTGPSDAQLRYEAGLDALGRRDFATAATSLEFAADAGDEALRQQSLLLLAVLQLDPGNPHRDARVTADLASRLRSGAAPGSIPYIAAETLERAAREPRDLRQDLIAARAERDRAWTHIDSLRARIDGMEMLHDSIRRRTARLEVVGDSITKELEKTRQELERIRRAIRG